LSFARPRNHRRLVPAVLVALVLAACSPAAGGPGGESDLTLSVAAPSDGGAVSVPFEVDLETSLPIGPPESGAHHVHLYFDTDVSSPDYDLVYEEPFQVTRELTPGEHTIIASLRNPDHSDAGVSETFAISVGEAGSVSASSAGSSDTPPVY
jgi:hypothetical protein